MFHETGSCLRVADFTITRVSFRTAQSQGSSLPCERYLPLFFLFAHFSAFSAFLATFHHSILAPTITNFSLFTPSPSIRAAASYLDKRANNVNQLLNWETRVRLGRRNELKLRYESSFGIPQPPGTRYNKENRRSSTTTPSSSFRKSPLSG